MESESPDSLNHLPNHLSKSGDLLSTSPNKNNTLQTTIKDCWILAFHHNAALLDPKQFNLPINLRSLCLTNSMS